MDRFSVSERSRIMARVPSKNTQPELAVRKLAFALGYRYKLHVKDLPGTPDLVFPGRKRIIFVHGCFWHGHRCRRGGLPSSNKYFWKEKITKNKKRDRQTKRLLSAQGWKVLTVWQCETKDRKHLQVKMVGFLEPDSPEHRKRD